MEQESVKIFLEKEIFTQGIEKIKQFSKGQIASFYIKTKSEEEFTIKFYKNKENVKYAYNVSLQLEKNKALKVPQLYKIPNKYLKYKRYYGLIFYYIRGKEIKTSEMNLQILSEVAEQYAIFQKSKLAISNLYQDKNISYYINNLRQHYLTKDINSQNKIKQIMYNKIKKITQEILNNIEIQHQNKIEPPKKMIHCDITKSNMLCKEGHFASFLDTDSVCLSYVGRDIAEFIISTVLRFPIYRNKKKIIQFWYSEIDKRLHLSAEEYIYGLDIYYLYRLQCRLQQYREKLTVGKYFNFIEFIKLRFVIIDLFRKKEAHA